MAEGPDFYETDYGMDAHDGAGQAIGTDGLIDPRPDLGPLAPVDVHDFDPTTGRFVDDLEEFADFGLPDATAEYTIRDGVISAPADEPTADATAAADPSTGTVGESSDGIAFEIKDGVLGPVDETAATAQPAHLLYNADSGLVEAAPGGLRPDARDNAPLIADSARATTEAAVTTHAAQPTGQAEGQRMGPGLLRRAVSRLHDLASTARPAHPGQPERSAATTKGL